jgi:hypothetical protein
MAGGDTLVAWFRPDGTFSIDPEADWTNPVAEGRYELDGETVSFTNAESTGLCGEGETWSWEVGLDSGGDDDLLRVAFTEAGCLVPIGVMWSFMRAG